VLHLYKILAQSECCFYHCDLGLEKASWQKTVKVSNGKETGRGDSTVNEHLKMTYFGTGRSDSNKSLCTNKGAFIPNGQDRKRKTVVNTSANSTIKLRLIFP